MAERRGKSSRRTRKPNGTLPGRLTEPRSPSAAARPIPSAVIQRLDLKTNQVSTLPGSKGLFLAALVARRTLHLAALTFDSRALMLFDFATQKWQEIAKVILGFPQLVEERRLHLLPARRK